MNAVLRPSAPALQWTPMTVAEVERILPIEQQVYSHPWTRGNFIDSLAAGHLGWVGSDGEHPVAYWVAMAVLDEFHLLNLAVARDRWGQGWGRVALQHMVAVAQERDSAQLWLEVRVSNLRAQAIYTAYGFRRVGERKRYYPAHNGEREDAIVMSRML